MMQRQSGYLNVGDVIVYGKFKNALGKVVGFGSNAKGDPTISVQPMNTDGTEKKVAPKEMVLLKVRKVDPGSYFHKKSSEDATAIEALADYAHASWSGWMKYLFSKSIPTADGSVVIPKELVARWERQMNTPYQSLPENEKKSDRDEAEKILSTLEDI